MSYREILNRIAAKKAKLDKRRPLPNSIIAKLKEHFDAEWTYHSNAIEGSTLTLAEIKMVIADGLTVGGKSLVEHLEAINHKHAIDFVEGLAAKKEPITEHAIRQIHALILRTIDDEEVGRYRRIQVYISGSEYVPPDPSAVPPLMNDFVGWLNSAEGLHSVERAALAHFKLAHIHPFVDGNGRVARLFMNLILIRDGYPPAVIRKEDRALYYETLGKADEGDTAPLVALVAEAVDRSLGIYLSASIPSAARSD